ncbi:MAG: 3-oxoacyl-[acyl-carrier-protein] reductase [Thermoguttaceae bacterium]
MFLPVDLTAKTAVVTGATRGIGYAIAKALAASGAKVACIGTNTELLEKVVNEIRESGGSAEPFPLDITDEKAVAETSKAILTQFSKVDILVNNAGITRDMLIRRMTDEEWDSVIAVNLRGPFLMTRAFTESMRKAKYGRIINISSVSGLIGNRGQANYGASKAGLIAFTKTVALELANRHITVNAVAPGFIETDMVQKLDPLILQGAKDKTPVGRLGQPNDIANAVLFLASEYASFITGEVLVVDGGLTV